jgi:hypothetical protein
MSIQSKILEHEDVFPFESAYDVPSPEGSHLQVAFHGAPIRSDG